MTDAVAGAWLFCNNLASSSNDRPFAIVLGIRWEDVA